MIYSLTFILYRMEDMEKKKQTVEEEKKKVEAKERCAKYQNEKLKLAENFCNT